MLDELQPLLEGRYRIDSELGHGGMAFVFRAIDLRHERAVALKVLRPELASAVSMQRFLAETKTSARLQHPHLLPVLDSGAAGPYLYYVMPLVEGGTLRQRLMGAPELAPERVAAIGSEIADALDYLHRQGHVHRDVKPENILIAEDHAYLSDLGVARALEPARREYFTETGLTPGTARYMSPEQREGTELDGRSDIYSLGVVLDECLGDQKGPALRAAISRMRAQRRDDRPKTAGEARETLRALAPTSALPVRRSEGRYVAYALGGIIVLLAALGLWTRPGRSVRVAQASDSAFVVFPFEVHGGDARLGESLPPLVAEALNGERVVRCRETRPVTEYVRAHHLSSQTARDRARVLGHFRARLYVAGEATAIGNRVRIAARMAAAGDRDSLIASAVAEGSADSLSSTVARIAVDLLAEANRDAVREDLLAGNPHRPLDAIRSYLDGEDARRTRDYGAAARFYEKAIAADSSFALAWREFGHVGWWTGYGLDRLKTASDRANALSSTLSLRGRRLASGYAALARGDGSNAIAAFQQAADEDPEDVEALDGLVWASTVYGAVLGLDRSRSADLDRRLLALDPNNVQVLVREFDRSVRDGNGPRADSLVTRMHAQHVPYLDPDVLELKRLVAHRKLDDAMAMVRGTSNEAVVAQALDPFLAIGDLDRAIEASNLLDTPKHSDLDRLAASLRIAWIEESRGRWNSARAALARARTINPAIGDIYEAVMACALPRLERPEYERVRAALAADTLSEKRFAGTPMGSFYLENEGSWTATRLYALGLLDATASRRAGAEVARMRLRALGGDETSRAWASVYDTGIEARLLAEEGRTREALSLLERMPPQSQHGNRIGFRTLTSERFLRIRLLHELGDEPAAARWAQSYRTFYFDMIAQPEFSLIKARALAATGKKSDARKELEQLLRRLDHPDPLFVPIDDAARMELRALSAS